MTFGSLHLKEFFDTMENRLPMLQMEGARAVFLFLPEDRKGNMWFGSIGSGVYQYDGRSFKNFTTKDGLLNNEISWIL